MSVINTNITAMIGQQNLNASKSDLTTSMERLSSGLRINSAKDDAAGQAIANRMTSQITGLSQAQRNANDGISAAQTAEGALNQINDNVQRIRELTVQAANDTNSQKDLGSIQDEIDQRIEEIDRISKQTDFNGTKVLDDGVQEMDIQVGANDGETITVKLQTINSTELQIDDFSVRGIEQPTEVTTSSVASGSAITIDGQTYTAIDDVSASGQFASGNNIVSGDFTSAPSGASAGNTKLVETSDGRYFARVGSGSAADFYEVDFTHSAGSEDTAASVTFSIKGGADATAVDAAAEGLTDVSGDVESATTNPLSKLDDALNQIDSLRSELGAVQNRFESAITNLQTNETNLSSARSRIEDADYATEVSNMTRAQILQQAGTSVLAQANQIPQSVLSLLG